MCLLLRKLKDLEEAITEKKSDSVTGTETWPNPEINDAEVSILDYAFFQCGRSENLIGLGVAFIIYEKLKPQPIHLEEDASNLYIVACKMKHKSHGLNLLGIY